MGVLRPQPARGAGVSAGGARRGGRGRPRLADKGGKLLLATTSYRAAPRRHEPTRNAGVLAAAICVIDQPFHQLQFGGEFGGEQRCLPGGEFGGEQRCLQVILVVLLTVVVHRRHSAWPSPRPVLPQSRAYPRRAARAPGCKAGRHPCRPGMPRTGVGDADVASIPTQPSRATCCALGGLSAAANCCLFHNVS
eukprot:COSAG01_NODE_6659_length_3559_cov_49.560694_2_plen_193_part_00